MELEFVIGRDNSQKIKLSDTSTGKWATSNLTTLSRAILQVGELVIDSNINPEAFDLDDDDGTITLRIGMIEGLSEGIYNSHLIIYRATETNGIKWQSDFKVRIHG